MAKDVAWLLQKSHYCWLNKLFFGKIIVHCYDTFFKYFWQVCWHWYLFVISGNFVISRFQNWHYFLQFLSCLERRQHTCIRLLRHAHSFVTSERKSDIEHFHNFIACTGISSYLHDFSVSNPLISLNSCSENNVYSKIFILTSLQFSYCYPWEDPGGFQLPFWKYSKLQLALKHSNNEATQKWRHDLHPNVYQK